MNMSQKPTTLDHVWPEEELCAEFRLPISETTGRSRVLSGWIAGGLNHAEKAGRRFFFEQDVIDYLWSRRRE